jgi:hypothetical protein
VGFWATVPYYTLFSNQAQYHKKTNSTDLQVNLSNKSLISRLLLQKHGKKLNQAKKKPAQKWSLKSFKMIYLTKWMVSDPLYDHQFGVPFGQLHFGPP